MILVMCNLTALLELEPPYCDERKSLKKIIALSNGTDIFLIILGKQETGKEQYGSSEWSETAWEEEQRISLLECEWGKEEYGSSEWSKTAWEEEQRISLLECEVSIVKDIPVQFHKKNGV